MKKSHELDVEVIEADLKPNEPDYGNKFFQHKSFSDHTNKYIAVKGKSIEEVMDLIRDFQPQALADEQTPDWVKGQMKQWKIQNLVEVTEPKANGYGKYNCIGWGNYSDVGTITWHKSRDGKTPDDTIYISGDTLLRHLTYGQFFSPEITAQMESKSLADYQKSIETNERKYFKGPLKKQEIPALEQDTYKGRDLREAIINEIHRVGREEGENPRASKLATMHVNKMFTAMVDAANKQNPGSGKNIEMSREQIESMAKDVQAAATKDLDNLDKINQRNKVRFGFNARSSSPEVSKAIAISLEKSFANVVGEEEKAVIEKTADRYIKRQANSRIKLEVNDAINPVKGYVALEMENHTTAVRATEKHTKGAHRGMSR